MRVANFTVFNAVDGSTNQTSSAFSVYSAYGWAAQFVITSTVTGTLKVQVSCDPGMPDLGPNSVTNWTDMTNGSQAISGSGTVVFNVNLGFYNWVRFVYTSTSGSGTITGTLNLKGV